MITNPKEGNPATRKVRSDFPKSFTLRGATYHANGPTPLGPHPVKTERSAIVPREIHEPLTHQRRSSIARLFQVVRTKPATAMGTDG